MPSEHPSGREERVNEVIADYLDAVAAGKRPDREEILAKHADLADELRTFFADRDRLAEAAEGLTQAPREPAAGEATPGTVRYFGDYELLEEIARGGMGVVYKARQVSLSRTVALKMILLGEFASEADVQRFRQEAQLAARLQHPGIVCLHEVGEHEGQHYFSMDYIEGQSLARVVRECPLPPPQAIRYARLTAEAIHFAHEQGVLHRDLKPSNVLIDRFDQPRVTDFGLAKNIRNDAGLTDTGAVLGTASYMPPEQASGDRGKVSPVSDVYSLGALLYELVTGRPPFQAATQLDTLLQVLEAQPAPPRLLNPAVSRDLETVILKCLEKDPAKRYASARDLSDDLGALLEGRPIQARRPSLRERAGVWVKQRGRTFRIVLASLGAAAVALTGLLLILEWKREARMGAFRFETDGAALHVEVFEEDGTTPALPPFTAPTPKAIRLPEGDYRVRVSARHRLSETYQMLVQRGRAETYRLDLSERLLGEPLPTNDVFDGFDVLPRDGGHDLLVVADRDRLECHAGNSGKLRWAVTLGEDSRPLPPGADRPREESRSAFFLSRSEVTGGRTSHDGKEKRSKWFISRRTDASRLLHPCRDLDGDGVPDLVWADSRGSALLALSGKDGKFLWDYRPAGPTAKLELALAFTPDKEGPPLVLAVFSGERNEPAGSTASRAEAVDARTGQSVWRRRFEKVSLRGLRVLRVEGKPVLVSLAGSRLVGLDPATGKDAWVPTDLGFVPVDLPVFADLDGDGRIDMLLHEPDGLIRARAVPSGKILWSHTLSNSRHLLGGPYNLAGSHLPQAIDLDGDGKAEVIVPAEDDTLTAVLDRHIRTRRISLGERTGERVSVGGAISVLDGATGAVRWRSSVAMNQGDPGATSVLVGPDLDGDGWRDLFVANVVENERVEYVTDAAGNLDLVPQALVRLQALSGKTGEPLWRCRLPYPDLEDGRAFVTGEPLVAWHRGRDGWPMLVVPGPLRTHVVEATTGRVVHALEGISGPFRAVDLDGDGIPELLAFRLNDRLDFKEAEKGRLPPLGHPVGWLHRFRGGPPELWRREGIWIPDPALGRDGVIDLLRLQRGGATRVTVSADGGRLRPSGGSRFGRFVAAQRQSGPGRETENLEQREGDVSEKVLPLQGGRLLTKYVAGPATVCTEAVEKGAARDAAPGRTITPRPESVEDVPFEWPGFWSGPVPEDDRIPRLILSLVLPAYAVFRFFRMGWLGVRDPVFLCLIILSGLLVSRVLAGAHVSEGVLVLNRAPLVEPLQPWQSYGWFGWSTIFGFPLVLAGTATLGYLLTVGVLLLFREMLRLTFDRRLSPTGRIRAIACLGVFAGLALVCLVISPELLQLWERYSGRYVAALFMILLVGFVPGYLLDRLLFLTIRGLNRAFRRRAPTRNSGCPVTSVTGVVTQT
jgi:outer membrane protein assembly factor BamB